MPWYHWLPIINLIFDFMFYSVPTQDAVKEIMNALGLVDALLLAVVMAIPSSVDHAELDEANYNFGSPFLDNSDNHLNKWSNFDRLNHPKYGWNNHRDSPVEATYVNKFGTKSNQLAWVLAGSSGALICALLNVVLTYFFLSMSNFSANEDGEEEEIVAAEFDESGFVKPKERKETSWTVWWQITKWLIAGQFISTAVGVVLSFIALMVLMDIKFPDDSCPYEQFAKQPPMKIACHMSYFFNATIAVLYGTLLGVMLLLSIASTKRTLFSVQRKEKLESERKEAAVKLATSAFKQLSKRSGTLELPQAANPASHEVMMP